MPVNPLGSGPDPEIRLRETLPPRDFKAEYVNGPYRDCAVGIFADFPQPVDHKLARGFDQWEPGRGYLIAESIPHGPTRRLLAHSTALFEALDCLEDALRDFIEDGKSADISVLRFWHSRVLKTLSAAASPNRKTEETSDDHLF